MIIKLEIELVPSSAWYSNLRSVLSPADWDIVRKLVYRKSGNICQICGSKGKYHVEAHEVWGYGIVNGAYVQKLLHVQCLCPLCHEAKHIGLAQVRGFGDRARRTLMRVNNWNLDQTEKYIEQKFREWKQRSQYKWELDISEIVNYGIDLVKYSNIKK